MGGAETDEHSVWSDPLTEPVVNEPSVHRSVCVELKIFGTDICAIMCSGLLDSEQLTATASSNSSSNNNSNNNYDDHTSLVNETGFTSSIATDASCARAFK